MNPRELLSLLTARVQRFHLAPGGIPNLTAEDVAAALGMIHHPEARLYARIKYCGQVAYAEELALAMRRYALDRIAKPEWEVPREAPVGQDKEWWLDMCRMAVAESVDPHTCRTCLGRAETMIDSKRIVCSDCRGTGRKELTQTDRARTMSITRKGWTQDQKRRGSSWAEIYRELQIATVDKYEDLIGGALRNRLGNAGNGAH